MDICTKLKFKFIPTLLVGVWKNKNKLVELKVLIDIMGIKSASLKDKFLF